MDMNETTAGPLAGPIAITGAAGFIGSHVAERLIRQGVPVIGVDDFDPFYPRHIKDRNLEACAAAARHDPRLWHFDEIDICDQVELRRFFGQHRPATVIHLAAKAGVRPSIEDPVGYMHANVTGTASVLTEARSAGVARAVIASSSSVYGDASRVPFSETDDVSSPVSPYAATKRACELLAWTHHSLTKMPTACLRFFTVYGPRQRPDLAIRSFMTRLADSGTIEIFGDGSTSRDYTYVDDIVDGVLAACAAIDRHGYRVWNLGGSRPIRLDEMIATIGRVMGVTPNVRHKPMQPGDVQRTWADLTRSRAELGYEPRIDFAEGLRRQWEWLKRERESAPARASLAGR